jgi:hypothetical protein
VSVASVGGHGVKSSGVESGSAIASGRQRQRLLRLALVPGVHHATSWSRRATERVAAYERAAIPQIETTFHTVAPSGRLHLIAAFARIGDGERSRSSAARLCWT